jgi:O-methyltransferase
MEWPIRLGKLREALIMSEMPEIFKNYTRYNQLGLSGETPEAITRALIATQRLPGDYYEFGLYAGTTFHHAQQEAKRLGMDAMHFWGFDSFSGLPHVDGLEGICFPVGSYACSRELVEKLHNQFGVDWSHVHLIEGWYKDVLTGTLAQEMKMSPAKAILIDCDLYCSAVSVLEFCVPLLQEETIVLFDDWYCWADPEMGERRALKEFLLAHPEWAAKETDKIGTYGIVFTMERT